jgi:hypothetical protein
MGPDIAAMPVETRTALRLPRWFVAITSYVLAFFWRIKPDLAKDLRSEGQEQIELSSCTSTHKPRGDARHDELHTHVEEAEVKLIARAKEVVQHAGELAEEIRQHRARAYELQHAAPHECRRAEELAQVYRHQALTDTMYRSLTNFVMQMLRYTGPDVETHTTHRHMSQWTSTVAVTDVRVLSRVRWATRLQCCVLSIIVFQVFHGGVPADEDSIATVSGPAWTNASAPGPANATATAGMLGFVRRRPFALAICEASNEPRAWLTAAASVCVLLSLVVAAASTFRNVYLWGVLYMDVVCAISLLQTLVRTTVLANAYRHIPDVGPICGASAALYSIAYVSMFTTMLASDLFRYRAPCLRLLLCLSVAVMLGYEVHARSGGPIAEEQGRPTGTFVDRFLQYDDKSAPTVQGFLLVMDWTVVCLMFQDMLSTLKRPSECSFCSLPCDLASLTAFYGREAHDRELVGAHRAQQLFRCFGCPQLFVETALQTHVIGHYMVDRVIRAGRRHKRADHAPGRTQGSASASASASGAGQKARSATTGTGAGAGPVLSSDATMVPYSC